jgi:murein tripeptide amidase MpaA
MRAYLDYDGIVRAIRALRAGYPNIAWDFAMRLTYEQRFPSILRIRAPPQIKKPGVLIIGGLHARELVNPDILVSLAIDLLYINSLTKTSLRYGGIVFPNSTIKSILRNLDIYILPLANPDGRVHAMNIYDMWRMNRIPNGGRTCPGSSCPQVDGKGVDLNRNFDFLWNSGIMTSPDPCGCFQIYKGPRPFSEQETIQIRQLLDGDFGIDSVVDVHSYREAVLHPWQIDENQSTDINMNFRNPDYDGQRGRLGDTYKEYIPQNDLNRYAFVAGIMRDSIRSVRGRQYAAGPGAVTIYPASATAMDYAYSRHFDSTRKKVFAMALETGRMFNPVNPENGVQVGQDEKWQITKEISAALVQFLIQRNTIP